MKINYIIGIGLFLIFITGCNDEGFIQGVYGIYGTAKSDNFSYFKLEVGKNRDSFEWSTMGLTLRYGGNEPIDNDLIARWDTSNNYDERKTLQLNVYDSNNNSNTDQVYFTLDNIDIRFYYSQREIYEEISENVCTYEKCNYIDKVWCDINGEWIADNYCSRCPDDEFCNFELGPCDGAWVNCGPIFGRSSGDNFGKYEIDYTNLVLIDWKNDGIILENNGLYEVKEVGSLGYLYYANLSYEGDYILRLRVYDKEGNLINEDFSSYFKILGLNNTPSNRIDNPSQTNIDGFLILLIEKKDVNDNWIPYLTLSDENIQRTILSGGDLKLSRLFVDPINNRKIIARDSGEYRLVMEFNSIDGSYHIVDKFEFSVIDEIFIRRATCEDDTRRLECSQEKPLFCDKRNELVNNCYGCGCPENMVCNPDNGDCTAIDICDGLDNDGDNSVDEDFPLVGEPCYIGIGECRGTGAYVCASDGLNVECDAVEGSPTTEVCDGLDNDCDGQVDEPFPELGTSCTVGTGSCSATGTYICKADKTETECNAVEGSPTTEVCDGLDNDCDGNVDDNLTASLADNQNGVCSGSVKVCNGVNGWQEPDYSLITGYETTEVCDGLDNDCDGQVDEDLIASLADNQNGVCAGALKVCMGVSGWQEPDYGLISNYQSSETICGDGRDNDCDGNTDDSDSSCGGRPIGTLCLRNTVCASGNCKGFRCSPSEEPSCKAAGESCLLSNVCCSGLRCRGEGFLGLRNRQCK